MDFILVFRPLTAAQQWAHVKPGNGPKIFPAKSPALNTAREMKPSTSQRPVYQPQTDSDKLWNDLLKATIKPEPQTGPSSSGLATARDQSFRESTAQTPNDSSTKTARNKSSRGPVSVCLYSCLTSNIIEFSAFTFS